MQDTTVPELPYAPGPILSDTAAHLRKLGEAWRHIRRRHAAGAPLHNVSGLERGLPLPDDVDPWLIDDEWAGALYADRVRDLGLAHLGGTLGRHDVFVANRLTAALYAAMQVTVRPGSTVVGVSATHSHPAVVRAVRDAGGRFRDTAGVAEFEAALRAHSDVSVVALTRLAVTYDALPEADLRRVVEIAHARGALVVVDDAGGARVGPAVLGQPCTLELGADLGATGLDKYGVRGPRVGLLGGRSDLVAKARARAFELGSECRPALYPAVARSLECYRPDWVRELVASARRVGAALRERLGADLVKDTPFISLLPGAAIGTELRRRAAATGTGTATATGTATGTVSPVDLVPVEATAALAMVLLRDHGLLTVHFAGLPPGTADLLIKFLPPATVAAVGGPAAFAAAVDAALDETAGALADHDTLRGLLFGARAGDEGQR
jgi:L-seryl-tRNA(Ser) seleniumtransferase